MQYKQELSSKQRLLRVECSFILASPSLLPPPAAPWGSSVSCSLPEAGQPEQTPAERLQEQSPSSDQGEDRNHSPPEDRPSTSRCGNGYCAWKNKAQQLAAAAGELIRGHEPYAKGKHNFSLTIAVLCKWPRSETKDQQITDSVGQGAEKLGVGLGMMHSPCALHTLLLCSSLLL